MNDLLVCSGLSVSFGGIRALHQVDFSIRTGEVLGVFGPNGAGKTTLFNAITGHAPLRSGTIVFDGRPINGLRPDQIFRRKLARTFQLPELIESRTVEANILLGAHFSLEPGPGHVIRFDDSALKATDEAIDLFELGQIRRKRTELTNLYERKLIMLASAYAAKPKLMLLDEPAGGLTESEIATLIERMRDLAGRGITILLIEHVMEVLMGMSTRVLALNQGQVLAEGAPEDIREDERVRQLYFGEVS